jgi:hypothetical protein
MSEKRQLKNGVKVKTHHSLSKITQDELLADPSRIFTDADQGIQTAIVSKNGNVHAVVGLNGIRYLPDPDPDPLDEVLRVALEGQQGQRK